MTMHDDELRVSADTARQLILDQFPEWGDEAIEEIHGAGTDNTIFRVGRTRAARFHRRRANATVLGAELLREAAAMRELAEVAPVPTPSPIAIGRPGHQYPLPWTLQSWIPGTVATPLGSAHSRGLARQLAELIASIRAAPTRGRQFVGTGRGGDLTASDQWMDTCFSESAGLLDVPRLRAMWAEFRQLPRDQPDVMTHGDLTPPNLLLRESQLLGVLDAGGLAAADPSLDLIVAWHLFDDDGRTVLRDDLGADRLEWQRGAAWAFQQAMGLVWYYQNSNPGMAQLGRSTLARISGDLELSRTLFGVP